MYFCYKILFLLTFCKEILLLLPLLADELSKPDGRHFHSLLQSELLHYSYKHKQNCSQNIPTILMLNFTATNKIEQHKTTTKKGSQIKTDLIHHNNLK